MIEARLTRSECLRRLGLDTTAGLPQIRRAYRRLVLRYHPKRFHTRWTSNHRFTAIVMAYQELMLREREQSAPIARLRTVAPANRFSAFTPLERPRVIVPAGRPSTFSPGQRARTFVLADGLGTFRLTERPETFMHVERSGVVTSAEAAIAQGLTPVNQLPSRVDFTRLYLRRMRNERVKTVLGAFLCFLFIASSLVAGAVMINEMARPEPQYQDDNVPPQGSWLESSETFVHTR